MKNYHKINWSKFDYNVHNLITFTFYNYVIIHDHLKTHMLKHANTLHCPWRLFYWKHGD